MNSIHPSMSRRTLMRGAVGLGAAVALGGLTTPARATGPRRASSLDLSIIDCDTWGAVPPTAELTTLDYTPTYAIVHHMAFDNTTDYSLEAAYAVAQECQDLHIGNGWGDSGQQFSISRGGYVLEGRHGSLGTLESGDSFMMGAQCKGYNESSIGIENEGTYTDELPPQGQWDSLVALLAHVCTQYDIPTDQILGHRDFNDTECPGEMLYAELPQLRIEVGEAMG